MKKDDFSLIFNLANKHPWVVEKIEILQHVLFQECKAPEEQSLFLRMLDDFCYVTLQEFSAQIEILAESIVTSNLIKVDDPSKVIVSAMAQDSSPDSSQALIQYIKLKFQNLGWNNIKYSNKIGDIFKIQKEEGFKRNIIIIIDDFLGSGKTALTKVNFFKGVRYPESFENKIYFGFMYGSKRGVDILKESGVEFEIINILKKGISDFEDKELVGNNIELMKKIESNFSGRYGSHSLDECSMGYGGAEALFAVEKQSIPNSVFPIFWWGLYKDQSNRTPLFERFVS